MNVISSLSNIPVSHSCIGDLFPKLSGKNQKVRQLEQAGEIVRLKRGLYVVSPEVSGVPISTELIANHLYGPSYISMLSALRFYGLIPETVYEMQSVTIKHSKRFENKFGRFCYYSSPATCFGIGIVQQGGFIIASPEKALCDLLVHSKGIHFRYKKEWIQYLEDDIRLDMNCLNKMDTAIIRKCAAVGKKKKTLLLLAQMIEKI